MNVKIDESWKKILETEFKKDYFKSLIDFVKTEYQSHQCFPKDKDIFAAFNHCSFEDVKVVIIGQDPYHGPNQANGLCFSVNYGIMHPPSLKNIFKELETDVGLNMSTSGDLSLWAKQGVLLLNAILTVRADDAGSHQNRGWEEFTDSVINHLSEKKENIVFLLWGGYANKKGIKIDQTKHCVLKSGHPSPLSANRGYWFGNKHFSKTNEYLRKKGNSIIHW
tara:strand:+ start:13784 stop:14449 length:666 start_codon:yes stop_codon:yes gene_type:complete